MSMKKFGWGLAIAGTAATGASIVATWYNVELAMGLLVGGGMLIMLGLDLQD